jgi:hypothetical protein
VVEFGSIGNKFAAGQSDGRDSQRRAAPARHTAFRVVQDKIGHQDIDRPAGQQRGRLQTVLASGHIMSEIRQDASHKLANS